MSLILRKESQARNIDVRRHWHIDAVWTCSCRWDFLGKSIGMRGVKDQELNPEKWQTLKERRKNWNPQKSIENERPEGMWYKSKGGERLTKEGGAKGPQELNKGGAAVNQTHGFGPQQVTSNLLTAIYWWMGSKGHKLDRSEQRTLWDLVPAKQPHARMHSRVGGAMTQSSSARVSSSDPYLKRNEGKISVLKPGEEGRIRETLVASQHRLSCCHWASVLFVP